jgi:hypothetical protein
MTQPPPEPASAPIPPRPPTLSYQSRPTGPSEVQTRAGRTTQLFGILHSLAGVVCLFPTISWLMGTDIPAEVALNGFLFVLPVASVGITYWICSVKIDRGNRAAAIIALTLAMIQAAFIFLFLIEGVRGYYPAIGSIFWFLLIVSPLFIALIRLIWNLFRFLRPRTLL